MGDQAEVHPQPGTRDFVSAAVGVGVVVGAAVVRGAVGGGGGGGGDRGVVGGRGVVYEGFLLIRVTRTTVEGNCNLNLVCFAVYY